LLRISRHPEVPGAIAGAACMHLAAMRRASKETASKSAVADLDTLTPRNRTRTPRNRTSRFRLAPRPHPSRRACGAHLRTTGPGDALLQQEIEEEGFSLARRSDRVAMPVKA